MITPSLNVMMVKFQFPTLIAAEIVRKRSTFTLAKVRNLTCCSCQSGPNEHGAVKVRGPPKLVAENNKLLDPVLF